MLLLPGAETNPKKCSAWVDICYPSNILFNSNTTAASAALVEVCTLVEVFTLLSATLVIYEIHVWCHYTFFVCMSVIFHKISFTWTINIPFSGQQFMPKLCILLCQILWHV